MIASPEIFIAAAAERSKRIKLGTGVASLCYHHPLIVADRMVFLDHLTQGRIIVQLETPESHRARALAVFQLGFTGGSPIGALGMGYLAGQLGPRSAVLYPAAAMAVVLTVLFRRSGLWGHTATSTLSTPARS